MICRSILSEIVVIEGGYGHNGLFYVLIFRYLQVDQIL